MKERNGKNKYKIILKTKPSKPKYTQEEIDEALHKAIRLLTNDLILNGRLKIGK